METLNSFKGYGKVSEAEDLEFRRKTRWRIITIGVAAVLLLLLVVGAVVGVVLTRRNSESAGGGGGRSPGGVADSIKAVCSVTHYPTSCFDSLSYAVASENVTDFRDPIKLFLLSLRVARTQLSKAGSLPAELAKAGGGLDNRTKAALRICEELIDDAADLLNDTLTQATSGKFKGSSPTVVLRQWLSGALANQETCLDAVNEATDGRATDFRKKLAEELGSTSELTSNSLAIATGIVALLEKLTGGTGNRRRLLAKSDEWEWVPKQRMLLQLGENSTAAPTPAGVPASGGGGGFDATVAQDGTGTHKTIMEALAAAPRRGSRPFVIKVSAGKYAERVVVDKNMWNIVMIGDGIGKTVLTGSRNFGIDRTPTFDTATLSVDGQGFVGRDMTIDNTAGPQGQQAVALRVKADRAVFFRCAFMAYQDTLYAHSLRQFYRECEIAGTVDFMFGKAAAVFQRCNIMPRQPASNQQNLITAHGRTDPNEPTGFSIQGCTVSALGGTVTAPTFLGRPWGAYSRAVFLTTEIGGVVDKRGWRSWDGTGTPPETTVYGEYMNTGPGADTSGRVQWGGYKGALSDEEAQKYSVGSFIQGSNWLPSTVAYALNV